MLIILPCLQVTASWEGTKLVQNYVPKDQDGKPRKTTRELKDGEIILVIFEITFCIFIY